MTGPTGKRGQSVLEYFILFALIAALTYLSVAGGLFEKIKENPRDENPQYLEKLFRSAVGRIVGEDQ